MGMVHVKIYSNTFKHWRNKSPIKNVQLPIKIINFSLQWDSKKCEATVLHSKTGFPNYCSEILFSAIIVLLITIEATVGKLARPLINTAF